METFNQAPHAWYRAQAGKGDARNGGPWWWRTGRTVVGATPRTLPVTTGSTRSRLRVPLSALHHGGCARWRRMLAAAFGEVKGPPGFSAPGRRVGYWLFSCFSWRVSPWPWCRAALRDGGVPGRELRAEGALSEVMFAFLSQYWPLIAGASSLGLTGASLPPLPW